MMLVRNEEVGPRLKRCLSWNALKMLSIALVLLRARDYVAYFSLSGPGQGYFRTF